jgi:hypothetical protein
MNIMMMTNMMKKRPQRKCVGCREMYDKLLLFRISSCNSHQGRGAYVCKSKKCIEQARKTKALERSLKKAIPADIYTQLLEAVLEG